MEAHKIRDTYLMIEHNMLSYELTELPKNLINEKALSLFSECNEKDFTWRYVEELIGNKYNRKKKYLFRLGYSPVYIHEDYVVAKTILYPGMKDTPEYCKFKNSNLNSDKKKILRKLFDKLSYKELTKSNDFTLVKWFHDQGIDQVKCV